MTENVEKIQELINKHHRQTIHELADTVGISYGVYQAILTENLNMCHFAPSSQQPAHPHVPENHRVCNKQQHSYCSPSSILARLSPL
jgi:hypothetical protein